MSVPEAPHPGEPVYQPAPPPALPTPEGERLHGLDALRGIAVLAIFFVNINSFALPMPAVYYPHAWEGMTRADLVTFGANMMVLLFKVYPLFCLLFGAGLALMADRLRARGISPTPVILRRLAVLAAVGFIHGVFVWEGDILFYYAITGMVVCLLLGFRARTHLFAGGILVLLSAMVCAVPATFVQAIVDEGPIGFPTAGSQLSREALLEEFPASFALAEKYADLGLMEKYLLMIEYRPVGAALLADLLANGSYAQVTIYRAVFMALRLADFGLLGAFLYSGFMFLGIGLVRLGFFHEPRAALGMWRGRMERLLLWLGLPITAAGMGLGFGADDGLLIVLSYWLLYYGGMLMAGMYLMVLVPALGEGWIGRVTSPLRACGRMAFTLYLLQSVIGTAVFLGYGFGLHGQFGYLTLAGFAAAVCACLMVFSVLWLRRFRYGPAEWMWRRTTYFSPLGPLRR